jgi:CRISPR-associated protein Cas5t
MIALEVEASYANFRKSFARSYAETYTYPPPSTVYGMLLSLVGERQRRSHLGARLALGFIGTPKLSTILKKLSRFKYGVPAKQAKLGNAPDYMEIVCGIRFILCVDSTAEQRRPSLEERVTLAVDTPKSVTRSGILCLGLSDDLVDRVGRLPADIPPSVDWLLADPAGSLELPVWVDHVGSADTRWRRYRIEAAESSKPPPAAWTIVTPPEQL